MGKSEISILEVGSGAGKYFTTLKGKNVIHFDISRNAAHLESVGDVEKLPFRDNSFDVIYVAQVLEHCGCPLKVLEELRRVSKKKVIIKVPNIGFYKYIDQNIDHLYSWNEATLETLLKKVFKDVRISTNFYVSKGNNKILNMLRSFKITVLKIIIGLNNVIVAECD